MVNIQLASEEWVSSLNSGSTGASYWESSPPIPTKNIKYGRLYNWYAATDQRGIAPAGWHVPSHVEWETLMNFTGSGSVSVKKLKSIDNNGTDDFGFKALSGGAYSNGSFYDIGVFGYWWRDNVSPLMLNIPNNDGDFYFGSALNGYSIRLIKDNSTNEGDVTIDGDTYHAVTIGTQVWLQQNLAVKHYKNGDPILSDFSGTTGAVTAYNNDESNVYDFVTTEDTTHIQSTLEKRIHSSIIDGYHSAPSSSSDVGTVGEFRFDTNYIYYCFATNQWVRSELTTW